MPLVDHVSQPLTHWLQRDCLSDELGHRIERATAPIYLQSDHLQYERDDKT